MPTAIEIGNLVSGGSGNSLDGGSGGTGGGGGGSPSHKFKVKTDNSGASNNDQIILPTRPAGTYNFLVKWGDGTFDTITSYNQAEVTHTYAAGAGTYEIEITGVCIDWAWGYTNERKKIIEVSRWGGTNLTLNSILAFYLCINMVVTATDSCTLTGNLAYCFVGCTLMTGGIANWDFGNVAGFFQGMGNASLWNEDISGWDVTSCTNFSGAFLNTSMSQANYDALLISWAAQSVQSFVTFDTPAQYTAGGAAEAARNTLVNTYSWTITDGGAN